MIAIKWVNILLFYEIIFNLYYFVVKAIYLYFRVLRDDAREMNICARTNNSSPAINRGEEKKETFIAMCDPQPQFKSFCCFVFVWFIYCVYNIISRSGIWCCLSELRVTRFAWVVRSWLFCWISSFCYLQIMLGKNNETRCLFATQVTQKNFYTQETLKKEVKLKYWGLPKCWMVVLCDQILEDKNSSKWFKLQLLRLLKFFSPSTKGLRKFS